MQLLPEEMSRSDAASRNKSIVSCRYSAQNFWGIPLDCHTIDSVSSLSGLVLCVVFGPNLFFFEVAKNVYDCNQGIAQQ